MPKNKQNERQGASIGDTEKKEGTEEMRDAASEAGDRGKTEKKEAEYGEEAGDIGETEKLLLRRRKG